MKKLILLLLTSLFLTSYAYAVDIGLEWNSAVGAEEYIIYQSIDNGTTWDAGVNVGNITEYTMLNVPESGLVLFRISSKNSIGETINGWQGAWYNHDWRPPNPTAGLGIQ